MSSPWTIATNNNRQFVIMKLRPRQMYAFVHSSNLTHAVRHIADVEEGALLVSGNTFVLEHTAYC